MVKNLPEKIRYPLDWSGLFKLRSKQKLASLLNSSITEIESLAGRDNNYCVFPSKKNEKTRIIQKPKKYLNKLHCRLFELLKRIEPPEYLQSGIKGRSYISNASKHVGNFFLVKLDIENFYPTTTYKHIYTFFFRKMQCSADVSTILSRLCSFQAHLPTGSCLSQILAFFVHIDMFEGLNGLAKKNGLTMTCYVDDIVFSGRNATRKILYEARLIIQQANLKSNRKKERVFSPNEPKLVTGVILHKSTMRVRNRIYKRIHDDVCLLENISSDKKPDAIKSLRGKIYSASQIDQKTKMFLRKIR